MSSIEGTLFTEGHFSGSLVSLKKISDHLVLCYTYLTKSTSKGRQRRQGDLEPKSAKDSIRIMHLSVLWTKGDEEWLIGSYWCLYVSILDFNEKEMLHLSNPNQAKT